MALLLFLSLDRAQSRALCNAITERNSVVSPQERNHPVTRVVADVGAAAEGDARAGAPLLDNGGFVAAETRVVGKNVGDPPEAKAPHLLDGGARRHMEHRTVDPVEMLADVLDEQVNPAKVRFERRPKKVRQDGEVE